MKRFISVLLVLAMLFSFVACSGGKGDIAIQGVDMSSYGKKFYKYLSQGEYQEAANYYFEYMYGNSETEFEAVDICDAYVKSVNDKLLEGSIDLIESGTEMDKVSRVAEAASISCGDGGFQMYGDICDSKNNYGLGCSALESGDYETAIEYLSEIMSEDCNYSDSQAKLETAKTECRTQALSDASTTVETDFGEAIKILDDALEILGDDTEIQATLDKYTNEYATKVIEEAKKAFKIPAEDWEAASDIIKKAQQYLPDDEKLQREWDYYMEFAPVLLTELEYYDSSSEYGGLTYLTGCSDTLGNSYGDSFYATSAAWTGGELEENYNIYDIDKEYNVFTATVAVPKSSKGTQHTGHIEIYGDGNLLWKSGRIDASTKPKKISLDITGVTDLKVSITGGAPFVGTGMSPLLAEPTLQKTKK